MTSERLPGDFISYTDGLPRTAEVESLARSSRRRSPPPPLSIADVPDITARWPAICAFALSFDGYRFARGSRDYLMALADRQQDAFYRAGVLEPMPLNELRAALFFEQRNYRWNETEPGGKDLRFVRALIAEIANQVREGGAK